MSATQPSSDASPVCGHCALHGLCRAPARDAWPVVPRAGEPPRRQRVARGEALYRRGDRADALYAVHTGVFKTCTDGVPAGHLAAFAISGDPLGLDGLGRAQHGCDAVALEDASVCVVPTASLAAGLRASEPMQRAFLALVGRAFTGHRQAESRLARLQAEARLSAFLLDLSRRLSERGYSAQQLQLRMSRLEIASHLGLTIETVSRCFGKLQSSGVLAVHGKTIEILHPDALDALARPK